MGGAGRPGHRDMLGIDDRLLLHYTEPSTSGQDQPAIAGACFFGAGVIGVIESHHRGGGHLLLTWMQARFPALLVHDVLTPQAAAFFVRHGFAEAAPAARGGPRPPAA